MDQLWQLQFRAMEEINAITNPIMSQIRVRKIIFNYFLINKLYLSFILFKLILVKLKKNFTNLIFFFN